MSRTNLEVVQRIYADFAKGDAPAIFAAMDGGIVWNEAENFPYADRNPYVGAAAVGEGVFFRCATEWDGFTVVPEEFIDGGERIVMLGRYTGTYRATGKPMRPQVAHVWTLKGGKVVAFQQYADTAQVAAAMSAG